MGFPTGKTYCNQCGAQVTDWDCGTPGHNCYKDRVDDNYKGQAFHYFGRKYVTHVCKSKAGKGS